MLFIAYATLIITFVACVFMLFRRISDYDEIAYRYAKPGYILLTAGMLIGYPWAIEAWKEENCGERLRFLECSAL
jgi:ABC-type transport system involved in cytochrome c biogenesis permease subunit